jgi:hypothetical protein
MTSLLLTTRPSVLPFSSLAFYRIRKGTQIISKLKYFKGRMNFRTSAANSIQTYILPRKSENDKLLYRLFTLNNQMQVLCISDSGILYFWNKFSLDLTCIEREEYIDLNKRGLSE